MKVYAFEIGHYLAWMGEDQAQRATPADVPRYLIEYRSRFIKQDTDALIISGRGRAEPGEGVHDLVTTLRELVPTEKRTPITIRQSVIANRLKAGQDLRLVQVFAGRRQPSSTEVYRATDLEELRAAVLKYHPPL